MSAASGFVSKHPWMTFFLASAAIGAVGAAVKGSMGGYGNVNSPLNADRTPMFRMPNIDASSLVGGGSVRADFVDGQINIHGELVGGTPPRSGLDQFLEFIKANPALALGGVAAIYFLAKR